MSLLDAARVAVELVRAERLCMASTRSRREVKEACRAAAVGGDGTQLVERGIEAVHVAGDWMRQAAPVWPAVTHWNEVPAMAGAVCAAISDDRPVFQSVLVKGSRFMRTERVVNALLALEPSHDNNKKDNAHAA